MRQATRTVVITTGGRGFTDITGHAVAFVRDEGIGTGLLTVFCRHTSASLLIQENADPDVLRDLETFFRKLAPEGDHYRHDEEGPDDMPGHIRAALTQPSLSIPVGAGGVAGRLCSGDGIDCREAEEVADSIGGHPGRRKGSPLV